MDEDEARKAKANAKRAANRPGRLLRRGEESISIKEFMSRLSDPDRKWTILGGTLCRGTSHDKGGANNLTGACIILPELKDGNLILQRKWPWGGKPSYLMTIENIASFVFISKGKEVLRLRWIAGDFSDFTALTLLDARCAEEEKEERERIAKEAKEARIRKLLDEARARIEVPIRELLKGLPIEFILVGHEFHDNGKFRPATLTLRRTDTGKALEIKTQYSDYSWNHELFIGDVNKK